MIKAFIVRSVPRLLARIDERTMLHCLRNGDYHGYALAQMEYWRRWKR
jgi:hypothetical protein